jgi:cytochrome c nitrite reductase small subunit
MNEQYDGWPKSWRRAVVTCNDCHTPANFLGKYATKASNGFWHSFYFATGAFHEPIQIKKRNLEITDALRRRSNNNETWRVKSGRGFR